MRVIQRFHRLVLAGALAAIPGCDIIQGHGNVDVTNGTNITLTSVQLIYDGGDEMSGALGPGLTAHFTTITAGSVTAYGYDGTSSAAVASASGALADGQTITLTLVAH